MGRAFVIATRGSLLLLFEHVHLLVLVLELEGIVGEFLDRGVSSMVWSPSLIFTLSLSFSTL